MERTRSGRMTVLHSSCFLTNFFSRLEPSRNAVIPPIPFSRSTLAETATARLHDCRRLGLAITGSLCALLGKSSIETVVDAGSTFAVDLNPTPAAESGLDPGTIVSTP